VTNKYVLYGIRIESELPLPLHKEIFSYSDASVKYGEKYSPPDDVGAYLYHFAVGPQKAIFHYKHVALFTITNGSEVLVSPVADIDSEILANAILGTPLGILLLQRGFIVLHASAIEINGKVVCFVGKSGVGKSTTVCSLLGSGHELIADDVVAIDISASLHPEVLYGYPWMKVSKEVISALGIPQRYVERIGHSEDKMRYIYSTKRIVENSSARLAGLYFLGWAEDCSICQMSMAESLINMAKHQYGFVPKKSYPFEENQRFLHSAKFV